MAAFLDLHGLDPDAAEPEVVRTMLAVAADEMGEAELADRVRRHAGPR